MLVVGLEIDDTDESNGDVAIMDQDEIGSGSSPLLKGSLDTQSLDDSSACGVPLQVIETADSLKNDQQKESSQEPSKKPNYDPNNPLQSNNPQEPSTETNQPSQSKPTKKDATNPKLPTGNYEVEKLHAYKMVKINGKMRGKYFVEWKEAFEGEWGPARYSWVEARDIDKASKDEFHREYKEMDSTVRESLMT